MASAKVQDGGEAAMGMSKPARLVLIGFLALSVWAVLLAAGATIAWLML